MKVHELIKVLTTMPQDYEVVVDESVDYKEINPVERATIGHWAHGFSSEFVPANEIPRKRKYYHGLEDIDENAVILNGRF